ncbi:hypothetical protein, partial [Candidatus Binatus sp.]|uniref:hypothetical protein n=1 Tax=Candidatus Binatus sp. TaxID=2811406 RepID=UPI003F9A2B60
MADKNESFEAKDFGWLVAMSVLFFALVLVGFWFEFSTDWGSTTTTQTSGPTLSGPVVVVYRLVEPPIGKQQKNPKDNYLKLEQ